MTDIPDLFDAPAPDTASNAAGTVEPDAENRPGDPFGRVIWRWWHDAVGNRDMAQTRATTARLRRARTPSAVLSERAVHDLITRVETEDGVRHAVGRRLRDPDALLA